MFSTACLTGRLKNETTTTEIYVKPEILIPMFIVPNHTPDKPAIGSLVVAFEFEIDLEATEFEEKPSSTGANRGVKL